MRINDFLQTRNITVTTGSTAAAAKTQSNPENSPFAIELNNQLELNNNVQFSKHALERISERNIDINSENTLERLNKAVRLADEKGSNDALVMIDSNAFIVSVKNNRVITTLSAEDIKENVFTGIDSTVIM